MSEPVLALVRWIDICTRNGWTPPPEVEAMVEAPTVGITNESVGWLLRDDDAGVIVAGSRSLSPQTFPYAELTAIPRVCIVEVRKL